MAPCCLTHIEFDIDLPEEDVIQVTYKTSVHLSPIWEITENSINKVFHVIYF